MLRKASLSVMIFVYLFAGLAHFTRTEYFLKLLPSFIPFKQGVVLLTGVVLVLLGVLLSLKKARRAGFYGILLLWSIAIPVDFYMLFFPDEGNPLPREIRIGRIPFQLLLMLWAYWQSRISPKDH